MPIMIQVFEQVYSPNTPWQQRKVAFVDADHIVAMRLDGQSGVWLDVTKHGESHRLATTGVTTTVDALGRTDVLSPLFEQKVLNYSIPLVYLPTLYSRIGDLFIWICLALLIVLWAMSLVAGKRR